MRIARVVIGMVVVLFGATPLLAQDRKPLPRAEMNKYVISAKAGVVNVVEGDTKVMRARPFAIPEALTSGDELQSGDTITTGAVSRAEILLNPGSYLRLGEQSEFVFLFDNFTSDKLKLLRGSAVLEASALEGPMVVETPKASFEISRDGLYRFNIAEDGKAEVAVQKGRVSVGDTTIKEGKRATVEGGTAAIVKLNKQDADSLDYWSKERAKTLTGLNSELSNAGMSRTLGMSYLRNTWIFDPICRCYTFLPFGGGFVSPYGWDYQMYNPYGYYYYTGRNNNGGWAGGGGSSSGGGHPNNGGGSGSGGGSGGGGSTGGGHQSPPAPPPMSTGGGNRGSDREAPAPHRRP